ncbi:MAG TPA: Arm DNA-binding domain-containing protein, partial [bacterium]|nr:Arm DNA-binding domain-containing protein [bacterium]
MATRFTKGFIDGLVCEKTGKHDSDIYFDSEVSGLAIRIYPTGKKRYLIDYRLAGRQRRMSLGSATILTVDQARRLARAKLSEVLS